MSEYQTDHWRCLPWSSYRQPLQLSLIHIYYNRDAGYLIDSIDTKIQIGEELKGVKEKNLSLYGADLFESYYEIVDKFNRDCRLDKTEDIIWS